MMNPDIMRKAAEDAAAESKSKAGPGQKASAVASAPKPIAVTAVQICADYGTNQIAADEKWKGKRVAVTGTISNIGKDFMDDSFVALSDGQEFSLGGLQANFGKGSNDVIGQLRKGQKVTIEGTVEGISVTSLMLGDPKIVR
jgi:hypothetical protein